MGGAAALGRLGRKHAGIDARFRKRGLDERGVRRFETREHANAASRPGSARRSALTWLLAAPVVHHQLRLGRGGRRSSNGLGNGHGEQRYDNAENTKHSQERAELTRCSERLFAAVDRHMFATPFPHQ